jgi:hypothetical protein
MISVILAGRNDAHGGNVAKRAAISINTLADLLTEPDDEIVFVDWNSTESEPCFVQAISDTLTAQARARVKVVRVRPSDIPDIVRKTHLPLIDSIARNVGVRRSNPENPWILSTTTDVVLLPSHGPLAKILADLAPVLHHSARHGLPEIGWEDLDRMNPDACRTKIAARLDALCLKEIVRAPAPILYDGPGDFQLLPRALIHEIRGFDESLVFTYHTDANLAKRALLKAGSVGDLSDRVTVVHCDHYRAGSIHHSADRITNSYREAVEDAETAVPPHQPEDWGLDGSELEVFWLADQTRLDKTLSAVGGLVSGLPTAPETAFTSVTFNTLTVPVGHVVPHLANLLMGLSPNCGIYLLSVNPDMRSAAAKLITAMGHRLVETDADLAIIDFSLETSDGDPTELLPVFQAASELLDWPSRCLVSDDTTIILINAIHTEAERLVNQRMRLSSHMPYTTRVRVATADRGVRTDPTDLREISATSRAIIDARNLPPSTSRSDISMVIRDLLGPLTPEDRQIADPYLTVEVATFLADRRPTLRDRMSRVIATAQGQINDMRSRLTPHLTLRESRHLTGIEPTLSKIASVDDWENARWAGALGRLWFGPETANRLGRHASMWRDGHLIHVASLLANGLNGGAALTLTETGAPTVAVLDELFPDHVIAVLDGAPSPKTLRTAARRPFRSGTKIVGWSQIPDKTTFSAIVVNGSWVWGGSLETFLTRLAELRIRLRDEAVAVFGLDLNIGLHSSSGFASLEMMRTAEFWTVLSEELGLEPFGDIDLSIDPGTLSRLPGAGDPAAPSMGYATPAGSIIVPSLWCLQAVQDRRATRLDPVYAARKALSRIQGNGVMHRVEIRSSSVRVSENGVQLSSDPHAGGLHGLLFRVRGLEIDTNRKTFSFRLPRDPAATRVSGQIIIRAVTTGAVGGTTAPHTRTFEIAADQVVGRVVQLNIAGPDQLSSQLTVDVLVLAVDLSGVSFSEISLS